MINNMKIFNTIITEEKINYSCPSCGEKCYLKNERCKSCGYILNEYKSILFSKYVYYNNAIDEIHNEKYFKALINITKFLALEPKSEKGNEIYIYLLYKNNQLKEYEEELIKFENKFKYSSLIRIIEEDGIEKYIIPQKYELDIKFESESFNTLSKIYITERNKIKNEIIEYGTRFFDIVSCCNIEKLKDFYEKIFLSFLSKYEISFLNNNNKNYYALTDDEKMFMDIIGEDKKTKKQKGTITTLSPAIFIRSKIISKEKIIISNNERRFKWNLEK